MARARAPRKAPTEHSPEDRLIDAALKLAAEKGWRQSGLAEIAAAAGLRLDEAYALHRSKAAILAAFTRRVDRAVLAGAPEEAEGTARERLFDTLMRRFEALKPHRAALMAIARDSVGRPSGVFGLCRLRRSMVWMLAASGIATGGLRGRLVANATLALYLTVMRVFLNDDSPDLGRTMAALDRGLQRASALCGLAGASRRGPRSVAAA